jgi:hypothetical protein
VQKRGRKVRSKSHPVGGREQRVCHLHESDAILTHNSSKKAARLSIVFSFHHFSIVFHHFIFPGSFNGRLRVH